MAIYSLNRLIARVTGKLPLRTVLIVPFVLQIVGTVGLVGYLSYKSGQKAVNSLGNQLINEVGDRVDHYLKTYLSTPQLINHINVDAIREGTINLQDLPKLERHMFVQLLQFNSVTTLVIGNEQGDLRAYSNSLRLQFLSSDPSNTRQIYDYTLDSNGKIIGLFRTFQQPDVRQRPWYRVAQEARKQVWSPIFSYGDNTDLAINLSHPIYDQTTNKFLGVVSVNLGISNISEFLNKFNVGKTGEVLIIDRQGLLVASSTNEPLYMTNIQRQLERLDIANSSHILTKSTGQYLRKQFGDFTTIKNKQQLEFIKDNQRQFVQVIPFKDEFGLDWLIVVVVPESDFMEQINANTRTTIVLCVAALSTSIGIGVLLVNWLTKPIISLNTATKELAKGEWHKTVETRRSDEVGELAKSFNQMATQLQQSFADFQSLNETLAQSESKLKQFLEAMPVGVSFHDLTGQITYLNQTARQLLGIETILEAKTEKLAQTYQIYQAGTEQLYPVEKLPIIRSLQGELARVDDIEICLPYRTIPLETYSTPLFDETGKIVGVIAVFQDITERKQAEKILSDYNHTLESEIAQRTAKLARTNQQLKQEIAERQKTEAKLYEAQRIAHIGSWEYDITTQITTWSEELYHIYGLDPSQPPLQPDETIKRVHPDDRDRFIKLIQEKAIARQFFEADVRIILKDGSIRHIEARGKTIFDELGYSVSMFGTVLDISERKIAEIELQKAKETAEVANQAKSTFLANMSHELRTPLNGILGYAQILQRDSNITSKQKEGVEIIYQCGEHLLRLINDILDLSKIEAEKIELSPEKFDFSSFLIGVCDIFRLKARQKGIDFIYLPLNQLPTTIYADEKRLRQILINFISNAVKFTDAGSVTFKVGVIQDEEETTKLDETKLGKTLIESLRIVEQSRRVREKSRRRREQSRKTKTQAAQTRSSEQNDSPLPTTSHESQTFQVGGMGNRESGDKGKLPQSPTTNNPEGIRQSLIGEIPKTALTHQQKRTKIRFQIEDTGVGMTGEQLEKIFLPFEQVGDTSRRAEGTGLGLSITEKLISLMGSKIFVESTPGIGSKFCFDLDLPATDNSLHSISVKQTNTIIGYEGEKQKILVVDDRWQNCSVIINILEPLGFELEEAANGQQGLETAVEFQPNLIITDLVMPVIDGFEMTRRLRQLPAFQDTIIIATSASVFAGDRQKSLEFGCQDFLPKPIQLEDLLDKIQHYFNLTWIYDQSHETQSQEIEDKSNRSTQFEAIELLIPPKEELIALYEAAKGGAVQAVEQEVLRLQELNSDYTFFTIRILELAQNFDYEEIVKLIDGSFLED